MDPEQSSVWHDAGMQALQRCGHAATVRLVEKKSIFALPELLGDIARYGEECFDLVFIDGAHTFDDVMVDCAVAVRLVRPGGAIVLDDVNPSLPGVLRAANYLRRNYALCLALVEDSPLCATAAVFIKSASLLEQAAGSKVRREWAYSVPF